MSNINIFELESVQDLNEKEVSSVIGGGLAIIGFYKDFSDKNVQLQNNPTVTANNQSAFGSGADQIGSGNHYYSGNGWF